MKNWKEGQLQEALNDIQLKQCSHVRIGEMLHFQLPGSAAKKEILRGALRILRNEFSNTYSYLVKGKPKTVLLFSSSYCDRKDHLRSFEKVSKTLEDAVIITAKKRHLSVPSRSIPLAITWIHQLKTIEKDIAWRINIVSRIQQGYSDYCYIQRILKNNKINILNLVVYCDVLPVDNFMVQMYRKQGVQTITLQHAVFEKNYYAYTHSICDWFLAHNYMSKQDAMESGIPENKINIVGMPSLIGNPQYSILPSKKTGKIGIILGGRIDFKRYDCELINMVKKFKQDYGGEIYIKFHPGYGPTTFTDYDWNGIDTMFEDEITAYEFAQKVDFTVINCSSLFVEYTLRGETSFNYLHSQSIYKGHDELKMEFSTYDEMKTLFLTYRLDFPTIKAMIENNLKYFSTEKEPFQMYHDFWREKLLR